MQKLTQEEEKELNRAAVRVRRNVLRMMRGGHSGHIGGAFSAADIVTALYCKILKVDPANPKWPERDRFVLSAGHKCLALYAALVEKGFFDASILDTYGSLGTILGGHPDMHKVAGVETSTGALGHGLSIAGGMAMGLRMDGLDSKVYVVMGDGELAEGSNWEAASAASHHKLDNLLLFVDRNSLQMCGKTVDVMCYEPLRQRWEAFGWSVREIDGHSHEEILAAGKDLPFSSEGQPSCLLAHTVKGRGVSFMENKVLWHYRTAQGDEFDAALKELEVSG